MDQPNLAQIAYKAYCSMMQLFVDGQPAPPAWESLSHKEHAAWTYAVDKVEDYLRELYSRRTHT